MEADILLWLQNNLRYPLLDKIMIFITSLGNIGILWIVLSVVFLSVKKMRKIGFMTSLALIYDLLFVNVLIKNLIKRVRPYEVIEGLTSVIGKQSEFSFPSGHTAASFAFCTVLLIKAPKKMSLSATVCACLIAFSRLYLGVHYPTDILGGTVIGILCAFLSVITVETVEKKLNKK